MVEIGEVFERGEKRVRWPLVGGGRSVVKYVRASLYVLVAMCELGDRRDCLTRHRPALKHF